MTARIEIVSASAGTGKTFRLAKELAEAVADGRARPDAIVAITFTNRAAAELARRLRANLLQAGRVEQAARIRDGYLGTVHSVCQRLIRELAFEAGLSPFLEPAPEALKETLYRGAVDSALGEEIDALDAAMARLDLHTRADAASGSRGRSRETWRSALQRAVRLAVENRMPPEALDASQARSWEEVRALLDAPEADPAALDDAVAAAVTDLLARVEAALARNAEAGKPVKAEQKRHVAARAWAEALRRGQPLPWRDIAELSKRRGDWKAKAFDPVWAPLAPVLATHLAHARLHEDLRGALQAVFGATGRVARAFRESKAAERLVDFEDMLSQAADLLGQAPVRAHLAGRLDLVLVDEFQDTSPVQLAAILGLCRLARRSLWVGDRKQAIFGFQGSDPDLMARAADAVRSGPIDVLGRNYRSRPALVDLCSTLFARALARDGFSAEEVRVEPACPEPPALAGAPAAHLWHLDKAPGDESGLNWHLAVARGVRELLDEGLIVRGHAADPTQPAPTRPLRPGDIAVLAYRNVSCRDLAAALRQVGLSTRVQLDQLGQEPLTGLVRAGLALLVDPRDRLAAAEVAWLCGDYAGHEGAWLAARVRGAAEPAADLADHPQVAALRALAAEAWAMGPLEAVDAVLAAVDAPNLALGLPDPERSLANLEALRGVARDYEQTCAARRVGATVAGLVQHVDALPDTTPQGVVADADAVHVITWHRAKGLEWPVVVLTELERGLDASPWALDVRPAAEFDATEPLADRTLRWWPNPYGTQDADMPLAERARASAAYLDLRRRAEAEDRRLTYVAMTRARDHLVLAVGPGSRGRSPTAVLDRLAEAEGEPLLLLPEAPPADATFRVRGDDRAWPATVRTVVDAPPDALETPPPPRWFAPAPPAPPRPPQRLSPSAAHLDPDARAAVRLGPVERIGDRARLDVPADRHAPLGTAVHAFLAADGPASGPADDPARLDHARRQLAAVGLLAAVEPATLLALADAFHAWLERKAPGRPRLREWPLTHHRADGRVVRGEIDLLVPLADGTFLLVDHKTFPGGEAARDERLRDYAGQLAAYREAVEAATGGVVSEVWVHLPARGEVVRVGA